MPTAWKVSVGHVGEFPVHNSATSQLPFWGRHSKVEGCKESEGHSGDRPEQTSAESQVSDAGRQTNPLDWKVSILKISNQSLSYIKTVPGQVAEVPLQ